MSRPEAILDVKDKFIDIGRLEFGMIMTQPRLLKHYTAFIEALQSFGGKVENEYGNSVKFSLPRTKAQLEDQLRSEQYTWDDRLASYKKLLRGEEIPNYTLHSVKKWAEEEGLPNPEEASDESLEQARVILGVEQEVEETS